MSRPDHSGYDPFDSGRPDGRGGWADGGAPGYPGSPGAEAGYGGYHGASAAGGYGAPMGRRNVPTGKGMAIAALVLGLLSVPTAFMFFGGVLAVVGIILAIVALRAGSKARKLGSADTGGTTAMSVIGIISSLIGLVIVGFLVWAVFVGVTAAAECAQYEGNSAMMDACIQEAVMERLGLN